MYDDLISRHHIRPWIGTLPGYQWIKENEHKLDGWSPTVELSNGNSHYTMHVKNPRTLNEVMKAQR